MMGDPVRFVKIRVCKNCGEWLEPGYKVELCPKCQAEQEESKDDTHDIL